MEQIFGIIISACFGAIFGSYATLFAYRLPRGESCFGRYFGRKSRCPSCDAIIKTRDLIPLLNWLITLGKCRNCHTKIPRIHLFVEFCSTLLFVLCYLKFGFSEAFMIHAMICVGLVVILACDITHKIFPQAMLIFILMFVLMNRVLRDHTTITMLYCGLAGIAASVMVYQIFYKRIPEFFSNENQAFDYVKLVLIASLYLHMSAFILYFFVVMLMLTILLMFKIPNKDRGFGFGYAFVLPLIWMIFQTQYNFYL